MATTERGHYNTPRSLREEARMDLLDVCYEHQAAAQELAHVNRRLANAHRLSKLAADKLVRAFQLETDALTAKRTAQKAAA
jgi:hypothetical protein